MKTCRCACGSTLMVSGPMKTWTEQMYRHVRTERHALWSTKLEADMTTAIIDVPVAPMHWADPLRLAAEPRCFVARSTACTSGLPSVQKVA